MVLVIQVAANFDEAARVTVHEVANAVGAFLSWWAGHRLNVQALARIGFR
jgi:hypothetical protein